MPRSFTQVVDLLLDAQRTQSPVIRRMRDILDRYDGDWVLPMPSVDSEPSMPQITPALIGEAVDKNAQRAASVMPTTVFPALHPNKPRGRGSVEYANRRRRIIAATYHDSMWMLGRRRAYRQLSAYHTCSLFVYPDFKRGLPVLGVRDPLATFVEPQAYEELRPPTWGAFITRYSGDWLRTNFPRTREEQGGPITKHNPSELWDVAEYQDYDQTIFGLIAPVRTDGDHIAERSLGAPYLQLSPSLPNKAECVTITQPHNVSLGKIASRISQLLGNVDLQVKLTALDILAQEKAIWPDAYVLGAENGNPELVAGEWFDGRSGQMNLIRGAQAVGVLRTTPDQRTTQLIDRAERAFRVSTGLIPQSGGENWGSLRTGRAMDSMTAIALDPATQELHEIMQTWMPHVNKSILKCYTGYFTTKKYTLFSGWPSDTGMVEFVPEEHIENTDNTVSYAIPGADITQMTQILGSLVGAGFMSRDSARTSHPLIGDGMAEGRRVQLERFSDATEESILAAIANKELPWMVAKWINDELERGKTIFEAMEVVDTKMREQQATAAPPAPEGMIAAPEAMLGLEGGPESVAQPQSGPVTPIAEPSASIGNMRQLMDTMV